MASRLARRVLRAHAFWSYCTSLTIDIRGSMVSHAREYNSENPGLLSRESGIFSESPGSFSESPGNFSESPGTSARIRFRDLASGYTLYQLSELHDMKRLFYNCI